MVITDKVKKILLKALAVVLVILGLALVGWWLMGVLSWDTYQNKKEGIIIPYPKGWEMEEPQKSDAIVVFVAPVQNALTPFRENVSITTADLSKNPLTIQQYAAVVPDQMTAVFEDTKLVDTAFLKIAGHDGVKIVFISTQEVEMFTVVYGFIYRNVAYNITYMGMAEQFVTSRIKLEHMIKTLKLYF